MPRVIIVTAGPGQLDLALSLGAIDLISVPFDIKILNRIVNDAFDPSMDDATLVLNARIRNAEEAIGYAAQWGHILGGLKQFVSMPLDALTVVQRQDLSERLLEAAKSVEGLKSNVGKAPSEIATAITLRKLAQTFSRRTTTDHS
jgi:hypothetical protein